MKTFEYLGKAYKLSDQLNPSEVRETILAELSTQYNRRTNSGYIKGGDTKITASSNELAYYFRLTAYDLHTFALCAIQMDKEGWEINHTFPCSSYGSYSYSCTFTRKPEARKADLEALAANLDEAVTSYMEAFEQAKLEHLANQEHELRERLQELTSRETERKAIYASLKALKEATQ